MLSTIQYTNKIEIVFLHKKLYMYMVAYSIQDIVVKCDCRVSVCVYVLDEEVCMNTNLFLDIFMLQNFQGSV
jgi:hypothetical protein